MNFDKFIVMVRYLLCRFCFLIDWMQQLKEKWRKRQRIALIWSKRAWKVTKLNISKQIVRFIQIMHRKQMDVTFIANRKRHWRCDFVKINSFINIHQLFPKGNVRGSKLHTKLELSIPLMTLLLRLIWFLTFSKDWNKNEEREMIRKFFP